MRKLLLTHYLIVSIYILLITLVNQYFSLSYYPLWIGAAVGALLPDLDHFIYIYYLRPTDLSSQRAQRIINSREVIRTFSFLAMTRNERKDLIFHNSFFQIIFFIFTFFVITSTNSLFGRGLVLSFLIHLSVDYLIDLIQIGNASHWFSRFNFHFNKQQQTLYWVLSLILIFIFGLVF